VIVDEAFCRSLWQQLQTFRRDDILAAVELSWDFPRPGEEPGPQDLVAQALHDIALHAESLGDWDLCLNLYRRVLDYPVACGEITADSRFRLAYCLERKGQLLEAIAAYRQAIELEREAKPAVQAFTRLRLARLLIDAEDYAGAFLLLDELTRRLPVAGMDEHEVYVSLGRCALLLGELTRARQALEHAVALAGGREAEIEALRLLAETCERLGDTAAAISAYRRIVASTFSEPRTKVAAAIRLNALTGD
jgi:tetratricopeptide (TPR) repeat protein